MNIHRLGKSWPPPVTAADLRESLGFDRRLDKGFPYQIVSPFVNRGPMMAKVQKTFVPDAQVLGGRPLTSNDLFLLNKIYNDDGNDDNMNLFRQGGHFIRFGRSLADGSGDSYENNNNNMMWNDKLDQQRITRARNHFLRLGRDSEEVDDETEEDDVDDSRNKRSVKANVMRN